MKVLLDTCCLAELQRPSPAPGVVRLLEEIDESELFISVISIGEITKGIELLEHGRRRQVLESWLLGLEQQFSNRILGVDIESARIWGELMATARREGRGLSLGDGLLAAAAHRHGLHFITRNVKDFVGTGIMIINPWDHS